VKKIFISYRRSDSAIFTGRLFDRLIDYYGPDSVFLDIDSIPSGVDFRDEVARHIKKCGIFLAIVGKGWVGPLDAGRRIDSPEDHVRIEVEQALAHNKPTIPVYYDDMEPLKSDEVPSSLQRLVYINACSIHPGRDFDLHVQRLRRDQ
jgi:hypothetical protein